MALQSTDRRTRKRFQQRRSFCFTGEKTPPLPPSTNYRSSDEWLIGEAKKDALLKAPVGVDPNKPPSTGWRGELLVCPSWDSEPPGLPGPPGPPRPLGSLGPPEPPGPPRSSVPPRPPRFYSNGKYEEDANIICTNQSESPCWILRVSLSGQAKKECSSCAGMYESTGLISMGRKVIYIVITQIFGNFYMISIPGV